MPPDLMQMMAALISTPSISSVNPRFDSSNEALCALLATWLADLGFAAELLPVPGHAGKFNMIATLGSGPGGLVLAGHTDTVPCDEAQWHSDPFTATERDGRLYGLGSADMKGFFALAVEAARGCAQQRLAAPLIVLATADEESSMSGARALTRAARPEARYAIIGEPTGLRPVSAHKGILMEAVRLTGRSAHSSDPSRGINAIDGMHRVIDALMTLRTRLVAEFGDRRFEVPAPTLNFGHIVGGDNPNRVCGQCELHFDLRLTPGMTIQNMRARLRQTVAEACAGTSLQVECRSLFDGVEAFVTAGGSELLAACVQHSGNKPQVVDFATEAPFLAALGMDTVIIGPGDIAQAHRPDEYLPLAAVEPTLALLRALIGRFCLCA